MFFIVIKLDVENDGVRNMRVKKMNIEKITKQFAEEGYFSEYLPPSFSISKNNCAKKLFDETWALADALDLSEPISFSMSRFTADDGRRIIQIPELTTYINAIRVMKKHNLIEDLIKNFNSDVSFSRLLQATGELTRHEKDYTKTASDMVGEERELFYIPIVLKKLIAAKGAKKILFLDISNFYGSIYTHLIPAIKYGYDRADEQYKAYQANAQDTIIDHDYTKYVELDKAVRGMKGGRTNGLMAGPFISQFLAEALLSRIDIELKDAEIKHVRYVDDFEIFIYDESKLDENKGIVERTLNKYFLFLNDQKTKVVDFPYYVVKNLQEKFDELSDEELDDEGLMELFNYFYKLEQQEIKGSIRFLIKSISAEFSPKNGELYLTYLINTLVNDSRSLVKICELIISKKDTIRITDCDFGIIHDLLLQYLKKKNDLEVLWLLYLLKKLGFGKLPITTVSEILSKGCELAIIMLIEEFPELITDENRIECINKADQSWMLSYQLFLREHIDKDDFEKKTVIKHNLPFYKKLKYNKFSFYHVDA